MTEESSALAPKQKYDMTVPDFLKEKSDKGREHITSQDIQMPRLAIAQGLSPELDEDKPVFIEGLKLGQMFNTMTQEIYGMGPIEFFIIKAMPPRGVEFAPRKEGGGVRDRNVPLDDPRMQWTKDPTTGDDVKPRATLFYDYLILMNYPQNPELIGMSLKSTGIKAAKKLNGLIQMRQRAIYTARYVVSTYKKSNNDGTWGIFSFDNAGWVDTAEQSAELEKMFDEFSAKTVTVDDAERDEDADKFDPEAKFDNQF